MLQLSKLTDYGIVLLTYFSARGDEGAALFNARDLAERSALPLPTVGKILKALARGGILVSRRGIRGGYGLARPASEIRVSEIISVLEKPVALTECSGEGTNLCEIQSSCPVRENWQKINGAVTSALDGLTLSEMRGPTP